MNPLQRLVIPGLILVAIVITGVMGYTAIEGWSFIDSLYMVVITLSTVGFREVHDLSPLGRVLTMGIIIMGVSTALYAAGQIVEMILEGQIVGFRRRRQMERRIAELEDHYIICGFGRVGHQVAAEFEAAGIDYVVIDSKPETAVELIPKNIPYIVGDITSDAVLESAGIKKAKGLIASADSDASNVFVVLSARVLNPGLFIIGRASYMDSEEKLKKAGANRVISPYFIAGKRMAAMATKPIAVDFLETVLHNEHMEMEMREFRVVGTCNLIGKTLGEAQIRQKSGAYVAAIRKKDGSFNLQPAADSRIEEEDILVTIGTPRQLDLLDKFSSEPLGEKLVNQGAWE